MDLVTWLMNLIMFFSSFLKVLFDTSGLEFPVFVSFVSSGKFLLVDLFDVQSGRPHSQVLPPKICGNMPN